MLAAPRSRGGPVLANCVPGERGARPLESLEGTIRMSALTKEIDAMERAIGKTKRHLRAREDVR